MNIAVESSEGKYRCGWCGHPCTSKGDLVNPTEFEQNPESYKGCDHVNGKCCAGSGWEQSDFLEDAA